MGGKWLLKTLDRAGVSLIDCVHKTPIANGDGFPYVTIPEMKTGYLDLENARKISPDDFLEWTAKAKPQLHDIVLSRRCNPGETAYVGEGKTDFALGQNLVLLRADGQSVYPPFLRWLVRGPEWWEQIRIYLNSGAVFDSLKCADVPKFELTVPPLDAQRAIDDVLGSLDTKIELNRQMNRTLDAMAQAIFKSWFVDFDPVTAKASGRKPFGMDDGTAKLFPSEFYETNIGSIPKPWRVGTVDELAKYVNGKNFTKNATGSGRMVIRIAELNSGLGGSTVYNEVEAEIENIARPGDLLFSWSGSLNVYRWFREDALVNQHIFKVVCTEYPQWFAHFHLIAAMPFFQGIAADKATTMGHIKREHLKQSYLALPSGKIIQKAGEIVEPLYAQILQNEIQAISLSEIRDYLLPKLLSGEVRVKQAEKIVEKVV